MSRNVRIVENGRLSFYSEEADQVFWDHHWRVVVTKGRFKDALEGNLRYLEKPVRKWLPKMGKVLEAGCGTGGWLP